MRQYLKESKIFIEQQRRSQHYESKSMIFEILLIFKDNSVTHSFISANDLALNFPRAYLKALSLMKRKIRSLYETENYCMMRNLFE